MRDLLLSSPQGQWWTDFNYFVYLVHVKKLTIKKIWIWIYPFWVPRRWVADSWQTQASRGSWSSLQMKVSPSTHVEKQRTWLSLFHQHTKSCKCVLLCGLWRVVDYCTTSCISFYAHSDLLFTTPTCFLIDILGTFSSENHVWGRICYETSFIHSIDVLWLVIQLCVIQHFTKDDIEPTVNNGSLSGCHGPGLRKLLRLSHGQLRVVPHESDWTRLCRLFASAYSCTRS